MEAVSEEEGEQNDFISREYQVELFNQAVDRNIILYLPTGSGKTYIAILLIKHFNGTGKIVPIEEGGKRTFFLVNTVALVEQQAKQIRAQTPIIVGTYSGDKGVDLWPTSQWLTELNTHQILVMTAQIFVDIINHNIITLKNVNLIVFDECHRAVSNHPMRQAMMTFANVPTTEQPRVLGLTATLLNGNIEANQIGSQIKELEKTFFAKISTSVNEEMVKMYSTNPKENRVSYIDNDTTGYLYKLRDQILENLKFFVAAVQVDDVKLPYSGSAPKGSRLIDESSRKTNKRLKNLVDDITVNMDDLGIYGGSLAVLAHLVQLQQLLPNCQLETQRLLYQSITTDCTLLRKHFETEMKGRGLSECEIVQLYSSNKLKKLLSILKKIKKGDSAIVFVTRRFTAKILYYIVKKAAQADPSLNHIKSNYIVGFNVGNPFRDTRENYFQRNQNQKVMNQFNQGEINVLFASNVVEEGVDIAQCNYVIMFNPPVDFRSYIQSKGRARDQNSNYIIMISNTDTNFDNRYNKFCHVERVLKQMLYGGKTQYRETPSKEEVEKSLFLTIPGLETFVPLGPDGPVITPLSSISLVNRYFASLKCDKFTKICPYWWMETDEQSQKFKCFLQLPIESSIADIVEGTWQSSKDHAKRSVALEACKKLYATGQLGELSCLPIKADDNSLKVTSFTPNYNAEETFIETIGDKTVRVGTKKNKRLFEKKWADCLCNCRPQPDQKTYLHLIETRPVYTPAEDNNRLRVFHATLNMPNSFALLSSKPLPKIASFPLYMSTGELEGCIKDSYPVYLNQEQLDRIDEFHYKLFNNVLQVVKEFMIKDNSNSQNSFLVVPVTLGDTHKFVIDWNAMEDTLKPFPSTDKIPSNEDRKSLKITESNYELKVVSPWYRSGIFQQYLVTKVCHDMSENSAFPTDTFATYKQYFKEKYKIEPLISNQPLLEVRALSSRIKCTKPRALTKVLKRSLKEENENFEVWLLPELCVVYPLDGRYWLKAQLLPSVLHRVSRLCIAEEVRTAISWATGLGPLVLPQGKNWSKLEEDVSLQKKEDDIELHQALKPLSIISKGSCASKSDQKLWSLDEEPVDPERNMDTCSIFDILNYDHFIKKPFLQTFDENNAETSLSNLTSGPKKFVLKMVTPPKLKMLNNVADGFGPEQVEVMQALTAAVANDFVNCERLETLGDSFLKFSISLMLFDTYPDYLEGHLTHIKGNVVGNKNLYFCGTNKELAKLLEVQDFSPKQEWVAPGFCVEERLKNVIQTIPVDPDVLYNIKIPENDRRRGKLSSEIVDKLFEILMDSDEGLRKSSTFINRVAVTDKNIADAVEAILGVYLKSCGIFGALKVLNWFGISDPALTSDRIFTSKAPSPAKGKGDPSTLVQPESLEEILNYTFKNKAYVLQALTHPSYTRNNITPSYERLEFLGDAVIDFLITIHIYEKCQTLSPGDLTDLRSALVNNITLGALCVRNDLYKYMLYHSSQLNECMMRFVQHQEKRNHEIDDDILFLVEEYDMNISEAVDVPKALGDIFEALIGAIYLDSGKDLNVTWKVLYNFMRKEIETFSKDIPKNHVRMLYETNCGPKFMAAVESNGAVLVALEIYYKGADLKFNGFGDNKKQAKRAAAKHAMRYIRSQNH